MSGGSYNYEYQRIDNEYSGKTYDDTLDMMIPDLCVVLQALEWWQSGDTSEEAYRKCLQVFKDKWFGKRKDVETYILRNKIDSWAKTLEQMKKELL